MKSSEMKSLRVFDASSIRQGRLVKKYLWKKRRNRRQTALWPLNNIFRAANACAEIIMGLLINQQKLEQSAAHSVFLRLYKHIRPPPHRCGPNISLYYNVL